MEEEVRRSLNAAGLDRHVPQIAELGIETMDDLKNPYMVTDQQLKGIGMSSLSIIRYRSLCSEPPPPPRIESIDDGESSVADSAHDDDLNSERGGGGGINIGDNSKKVIGLDTDASDGGISYQATLAASNISFVPLLMELNIDSFESQLKDACGDSDSCRTLLVQCPEARLTQIGIPIVKVKYSS
jgi:hypothetical protein